MITFNMFCLSAFYSMKLHVFVNNILFMLSSEEIKKNKNIINVNTGNYKGFQSKIIQFSNCPFAVPSQAPSNLSATVKTSTSIEASWQLPPEDFRNGNITGFKLLYKKKGSSESSTELTINSGSTLTKVVTGLDKYTEYEFQVLAFTSVGDGPKSTVKVEKTREDGM